MNVPAYVGSYGDYPGNYGTHCLCVEFGPVVLWYSYRTLVAFRVDGHKTVVHENQWGPTTGKHLRKIDDGDRKARVSATEFARLFEEQCGPLFRALDLVLNRPEVLRRVMTEHVGEVSSAS